MLNLHKRYELALRKQNDNTIVIGIGHSPNIGYHVFPDRNDLTEQTRIASRVAIEHLLNKKIKTIYITRPIDHTDMEDHTKAWQLPIYECFLDYITKTQLHTLLINKDIQVHPFPLPHHERNFHDCFLLADEMEHATITQTKNLLMTVGQDCHLVINGNTSYPTSNSNGLTSFNGVNGLNDLLRRIELHYEFSDESCFDVITFNRKSLTHETSASASGTTSECGFRGNQRNFVKKIMRMYEPSIRQM